jgi:hypothetical protein
MTIMRISRAAKRMRQGRQTANNMSDASAKRSAAVPAAPTAGNNPLASAAPA